MSTKPNTPPSRYDAILWIIAIALLAAGIVGNSVYADQSLLYRILALVVIALVAGYVASCTAKGKAFLIMLKEARNEIRRVVWPNRQETTQTTLMVLVVVLIMALVLWGLDSLFSWIVASVIG